MKQKTTRFITYPVILLLVLILGACGGKTFAAVSAGVKLPGETPSVSPEKVTFPSEDQDYTGAAPTILDGYVFRPEGPGPFPAIVALHGCGGLFTAGRMNGRFADWGQRLAALGYLVLFPDSFTSRGVDQVCRKKDRSGFSANRERVRDAEGALHWLQSQTMVQRDRIGLIGWSNGGTALLATIGALAKNDGSDDFRVAIAFYPGCTNFMKKSHWQPRLPLTIFIGEADDWTPAASCKALVQRANGQGRQAEIVTFANAYHDFDHPDLPLKTHKGLAFTAGGQGIARAGTNPEGRAAVLELVPKLLAQYLLRSPDN